MEKRGCRTERSCAAGAATTRVRLAYHLWMIKPIMGLDPDECDHEEN
jgi:hypothetical protein